MRDVLLDVFASERRDARTQRDPLIELPEIGGGKQLEQPWLADECNLQRSNLAG